MLNKVGNLNCGKKCAREVQYETKRKLAQVCSMSSCEQNWSSYSFVHSKVRNWLTLNWAKDLVYIYTNNKFLVRTT